MNREEEDMLNRYEQQIKDLSVANETNKLNTIQNDLMVQDQERGIAGEQLDLGEILDRIHNLLKGYVLKKNEKGKMIWIEPDNSDMVILTEYGVNYIMGAVQWYLNKNTLLSNYDDEQIAGKMEDFATTLVDDVFMEYDKMFLYPSIEDCQVEIERRIKAKVDTRMFALKLMGKLGDAVVIREEILNEMEDRIEHELKIIREQKIKNKLKRFESLIRFIQDSVHSTYQRAWKGQERTTLRQHIHISENKGSLLPAMPQQTFNPLSILRRHKS